MEIIQSIIAAAAAARPPGTTWRRRIGDAAALGAGLAIDALVAELITAILPWLLAALLPLIGPGHGPVPRRTIEALRGDCHIRATLPRRIERRRAANSNQGRPAARAAAWKFFTRSS